MHTRDFRQTTAHGEECTVRCHFSSDFTGDMQVSVLDADGVEIWMEALPEEVVFSLFALSDSKVLAEVIEFCEQLAR